MNVTPSPGIMALGLVGPRICRGIVADMMIRGFTGG